MKTHLSEGEQGEVLNMATTLEKVKQRRPSDITPLQGMTVNVHRMTPLAANGRKVQFTGNMSDKSRGVL